MLNEDSKLSKHDISILERTIKLLQQAETLLINDITEDGDDFITHSCGCAGIRYGDLVGSLASSINVLGGLVKGREL